MKSPHWRSSFIEAHLEEIAAALNGLPLPRLARMVLAVAALRLLKRDGGEATSGYISKSTLVSNVANIASGIRSGSKWLQVPYFATLVFRCEGTWSSTCTYFGTVPSPTKCGAHASEWGSHYPRWKKGWRLWATSCQENYRLDRYDWELKLAIHDGPGVIESWDLDSTILDRKA